ncbi:MAG: hypothetical protein KGJ57_21180 [Sphingomonadales bacterium]|nr:hypothetical protein [Sphingomonadales bacterium]MDE2171910.1 hypothetical protein [Sphingomonadales bacterium]
MQRHSRDEHLALIDRFMVLGARWCLSADQIRDLLAIDAMPVFLHEEDLSERLRTAGDDAERRMRLLVDVDRLLVRLVPDIRAIPAWLRSCGVGFASERVTPLEALSSGPGAIRALRNHLEQLPPAGCRGI